MSVHDPIQTFTAVLIRLTGGLNSNNGANEGAYSGGHSHSKRTPKGDAAPLRESLYELWAFFISPKALVIRRPNSCVCSAYHFIWDCTYRVCRSINSWRSLA